MEWYLLAWKRFGDFQGRSRRREYWTFTLMHTFAIMVLMLAAALLQQSLPDVWAVPILYGLCGVIPSLALTVRRLHDIGKSGWWLTIAVIPAAGLVVLILACVDSEAGPNQYGQNPKAYDAPAIAA